MHKKPNSLLKKSLYILQAPSRFLFEHFHPRLKVTAFYDMREQYLYLQNKNHRYAQVVDREQINQEIASLSNDMFGGQHFELFNNPTSFTCFDLHRPNILRWWRRGGGYVDWTISAIKEFVKTAQGIAELLPHVPKTVTGTLARRNLVRYLFNLFLISQLLSYFFTGLSNSKNAVLTWNWKQSHCTFTNQDLLRRGPLDIQLPDLYITSKEKKIALGRDLKGRKLYTHFGKKLLENFHYFEDPVRALYNKSNPILQILFVQLTGGAPTLYGIPFKEQQVYQNGCKLPWKGAKSYKTIPARIKHLFKSILPYSLQSFEDKGLLPSLAQFLMTGCGSLPIRKGLNLQAAEKFYTSYFYDENKYAERILKIDLTLLDYGYHSQQIQKAKMKSKKQTL